MFVPSDFRQSRRGMGIEMGSPSRVGGSSEAQTYDRQYEGRDAYEAESSVKSVT